MKCISTSESIEHTINKLLPLPLWRFHTEGYAQKKNFGSAASDQAIYIYAREKKCIVQFERIASRETRASTNIRALVQKQKLLSSAITQGKKARKKMNAGAMNKGLRVCLTQAPLFFFSSLILTRPSEKDAGRLLYIYTS